MTIQEAIQIVVDATRNGRTNRRDEPYMTSSQREAVEKLEEIFRLVEILEPKEKGGSDDKAEKS